jgi:trimeric autotransporter adhesin
MPPTRWATPLANGASYTVAVKAQPVNPAQTCVVTNATGTVSGAPVSNNSLACTTDAQPVGGTVSGLAGTGLVLRLNDTIDLAVSASGATYAVNVRTQPTGPFHACVASPATGTVGSSAVAVTVTCTNDTFAVGGMVGGLQGAGLTLQLNGGNDLAISGAGDFVFPTRLPRGASFAVTVKSQTDRYRELCAL